MEKEKLLNSVINYNYSTIKVTQSRINKSLLAIPVSLVDKFPSNKKAINIYLDNSTLPVQKSFTPYNSSSRECRIGGMKDFFVNYNIHNNDEIVIEFFDKENVRIITEKRFKDLILEAQQQIVSKDEGVFEKSISVIHSLTNENISTILRNEYVRLVSNNIEERKRKEIKTRFAKENVISSLRKILQEIYKGKCQVTGFTFLTKVGNPYFELHHIKSELGNHLKNLLVVSPNVHAQFTHAPVRETFDEEGWLREVSFNSENYKVTQAIDNLSKVFFKAVYE